MPMTLSIEAFVRYGINGDDPTPLRETGRRLGLSAEEISSLAYHYAVSAEQVDTLWAIGETKIAKVAPQARRVGGRVEPVVPPPATGATR